MYPVDSMGAVKKRTYGEMRSLTYCIAYFCLYWHIGAKQAPMHPPTDGCKTGMHHRQLVRGKLQSFVKAGDENDGRESWANRRP